MVRGKAMGLVALAVAASFALTVPGAASAKRTHGIKAHNIGGQDRERHSRVGNRKGRHHRHVRAHTHGIVTDRISRRDRNARNRRN